MPPRVTRPLPRVEPILLTPRDQSFDDPDWLFEPKYDGFRGLLYLSRSGCCIRSRRGHQLHRFDDLCNRVEAELPVREAILDGEVVALDEHGRQSSRHLVAGQGSPHYAAFDVLWVNGRDLRTLPLVRRKRVLHKLVWAASTLLSQVFTIEERGRDMLAAAERLDLEGVVAKRKRDPYAPSTVWYKIKNPTYTQAEGRYELFRPR
jgi:bifunctional non-homologous end joining protein LigD